MKLHLSLFLLLVFHFISSQAQFSIDSFDIATYARPDLERETAYINPFFGFHSDVSNNTGFSNNILEFELSGDYQKTKFINTAEYQTVASTKIFTKNGFTRIFSPNSLPSNTNNWKLNALFQNQIRQKKFRTNQKFRELSYVILTSYFFNSSTTAPVFNTKSRINGSLFVELLFGKGRIELVNDAWHAISILEFLEKGGLLTRDISKAEIKSFAERISEIKNFRNTDFRLEIIAEYEALSEYLIENSIIDSDDYRAFALVLDAWRYESFINRFSGEEFKYGLRPILSIHNSKSVSDYTSSFINYGLLGVVEHNHYRPIKNDWQTNRMSSLEFGVSKLSSLKKRAISSINEPTFSSNLSSSWQFQYLPSQRTNYAFSLGLGYVWQLQNDIIYSSFYGSLTGFYNYYLTPQLAWIIRGEVYLTAQDSIDFLYQNENQLSISLSYRFR